MIPWKLIDRAHVPGHGGEMCLYQRGGEFTIRLAAGELMNSRAHGSEDALAELACARIADRPCPRVLIGGLGMGYTTAAALRRLRADAQVLVAELVPAVVKWNRGPLGESAGHPLQDARVTVCEADVAQSCRRSSGPTTPSCWTWITAPRGSPGRATTGSMPGPGWRPPSRHCGRPACWPYGRPVRTGPSPSACIRRASA